MCSRPINIRRPGADLIKPFGSEIIGVPKATERLDGRARYPRRLRAGIRHGILPICGQLMSV